MRYLLVPLFMLAALACPGSATAQIRHGLCNDYGSRTDYQGNRYYIRDPENGRVVRQHWGMDFCTKAGTNVLAAADGTVHDIVTDNPVRGGQIILKSTLKGPASGDQKEIIYLRHLHITPDPKLKWGYTVRAGQVIGTVQKGGKSRLVLEPTSISMPENVPTSGFVPSIRTSFGAAACVRSHVSIRKLHRQPTSL